MINPVIILFAGLGGLGEGFEAFSLNGKMGSFGIVTTVECDLWARRILTLRGFSVSSRAEEFSRITATASATSSRVLAPRTS